MHPLRFVTRIALVVATLLGATVALAFTIAELFARAEVLVGNYESLAARVAACPEGDCEDRNSIEADFQSAESARSTLHDDRATLNPCGTCQSLDLQIAAAGALGEQLGVVIEGWESQP